MPWVALGKLVGTLPDAFVRLTPDRPELHTNSRSIVATGTMMEMSERVDRRDDQREVADSSFECGTSDQGSAVVEGTPRISRDTIRSRP